MPGFGRETTVPRMADSVLAVVCYAVVSPASLHRHNKLPAPAHRGNEMPIPANQVIHLEVVSQIAVAAGGSSAKNFQFVTHWRRSATVLTVSRSAFETAFQTSIMVPIMAALNITATQQFNFVRCIDDAQESYTSVTRAVVGSITGDRMSTIDAAFLLLKTSLRGRSYRGSKHLGPMSESDSTTGTDDLWNAACLTRLGTVASALLAGFTDATPNTWIPQVLSKKNSQLKLNPTNVVANDVTSVLVNKRIGSMRHRHVKSVY